MIILRRSLPDVIIPSSRSVRAVSGVSAMFASNGAVFAALLPWYPLIAERLDLGPAEFGLAVASFAMGGLASSALPARLIGWFGPGWVTVVGTILLAAVITGAGWATTGWTFAIFVFFAGFFDAIVDVAQNVAGIRVQDSLGRSILSSMHALWSLGGFACGALSTAAAASGVDIRLYLPLVGLACVVLAGSGAVISRASGRRRLASPPASQDSSRLSQWRAAGLAAVPLVVIATCGTMVEDVANNWAAMAGVQIGNMPAQIAGVAFTVVIGSQCIGRFTGDLLIHRFGQAVVARAGGVLIGGGTLLVLITTAGPATLLAGLAMIGYGSATLVPSALAAAAKLPNVSEGAGVTIVSWLMRVGFLVTSPLIGAISESLGLRWGLALLILVGGCCIAFGGALRPESLTVPQAGDSRTEGYR